MPSFPYNGQLDAFELYHKISEDDSGAESSVDGIGLPALGHALAGSAGTALSHIILYPLDLTITRLQAQRQFRSPGETPSAAREADLEYKSLADAAGKIYRNEGGLKAFYAGCVTDTSKSIVDAFLFFLAYTFLRQQRRKSLDVKALPILDELSVGIAAGAFSKFITTPIQQIVTRKQTAALIAARDPTSSLPPSMTGDLSIKDIALQIRSERGLSGFWAGYSASLILTLNPSLTFLFQNFLTRAVLPRSKRDNPGAFLTFLIAALSKGAASTVTYPFSLAKTRAQVSTSSSESLKAGEKTDASSQAPRNMIRALTSRIGEPAVIRSLRHIYAAEGVAGLYSGLQAEVLKGFLGHGLTMLLKERIHVGIVHMYYYVLQVLQQRPNITGSGSVGEQARNEVSRVMGIAGQSAQEVKERVGNVATTVGEGVKDVVESAPSAQELGDKVQNAAATVSDGVKGVINSPPSVQDVGERAGNVATTVSEGVKGTIQAGADTEIGQRVANVATTASEGVKSAVQAGADTEVGQRASNIATTVSEGVRNAANSSGAQEVGERIGNVASTASEGAKSAVRAGADTEIGQRASNMASTASEGAKSAVRAGADTEVGQRVGNVVSTVSEGAKDAASSSGAQEVGERAQNVAVTVKEGVKGAVKGDGD